MYSRRDERDMKETYTSEELKDFAKEKNLIYTDCKGCVFARPADLDGEDFEHACSTGRLKAFNKLGVEIFKIQSDKENDSDNKRFFAGIKDRICNIMRPKFWSEIQVNKNENKFAEDDLDALAEIAKKESRIMCNYIVYMRKDATKDECIQGLRRTVESICNRPPSESPSNLTVLVSPSMKPSEFMAEMRSIQSEYPIPCTWNMEYILDKEIFELDKNLLYEKFLKICMKSIKTHYIALFECGDEVPQNYLTSFEELINQKLEKVLLCLPSNKDSVSGTFIQYMAYRQFKNSVDGGEDCFVDRVKSAAKEQNAEYLIRNLEDVLKG